MWLQEAKCVRDLRYERICLHGDQDGVFKLLLDHVAKDCRPEGRDWQIRRQVSPTQRYQLKGAAERAFSTVRGLARQYLAVLKDNIASFDVTSHSPMLPWTTRHAAWVLTRYNVRRETRMTPYEREDSLTQVQERDPASGRTGSRLSPRSQRPPASAAVCYRPLATSLQEQVQSFCHLAIVQFWCSCVALAGVLFGLACFLCFLVGPLLAFVFC